MDTSTISVSEIFENASDGFAFVDIEGKVLDVNLKALEIYGGPGEELIGAHFSELGLFPSGEESPLLDNFQRPLAGTKALTSIRITNKKGKRIDLEYSITPYAAGDQQGILVLLRDVTDRKRLEEALPASEENYRGIVEAAPDGIVTMDKKGNITSMNPAFERLSGFKEKEILGLHFSKLPTIRKRDLPKHLKTFASMKLGRVPKPFKIKWVHKDGTEHSAEIRANALRRGKKIVGFQAITRDITGQQKSIDALEESEERFRGLAQAALDSIITMDGTGLVTFWNKAAEKTYGYTSEEAVGKELLELTIPERHRDAARKGFENYFKTGKGRVIGETVEVLALRKNGNEFPIELSVSPMKIKGEWQSVAMARDITERKKAEKAVRDSKERLSLFMDSATDGFTLFDSELNLVDVNMATLGLDPRVKKEDVIGTHITKLIPDVKETGRYEKYREVMRTGEPFLFRNTYAHPDFGERYLDVKAFRVGGGLGLISTDITEKEKSEQALRESEEKYRDLVDNALVGIYQTTLKGELLYVNEALARIFRFDSPEEMMSKGALPRYKDLERRKVLLESLRNEGSVRDFEIDVVTRTGKTKHILVDAKLEGDVFSGMVVDITEKKKSEQALMESEEKYRSLVERAGAGIVKADIEGRLTFVNRELSKLIGYSEEELLGESFIDFIHPDDQGKVLETFMGTFQDSENVQSIEFRVFHKAGHTVHLLSKHTALVQDGEIAGFNAIISDITERKLAEQASQENESRLKEAQRMADLGDWDWDLTTDTVTLSDEMYKIVGVEKDKITASPEIFAEIVHPDDQWILSQGSFEDSFQSGVIETEYRIIDQTTGDVKHIHVRGKVDFDVSEEPVRIRGTFQDITERKKAEEILSKRTYDLGKRYKELNCLYTISKMAEISDLSIDELLQGVVDSIPPSWQYPEVTSATIELEDWDISVGTPSEAVSSLSSDIFVDERKAGKVTVSYTEKKPPEDEGPFFSEERALINAIAEELGRICEKRQAQDELKRIEWLLRPRSVSEVPSEPTYGDLTQMNTFRLILDSVGKDILTDIASDYLGLLESSGAIYESNGDYALGIFSSNWCRFLDNASRELCKTEDNREALVCGKWLCHESCWNDASKVSIDTGLPTDIKCNGGIRLYAVPIHTGGKIVGSINFGYGDPPTDPEKLQEIADKYGVPVKKLQELAALYESRPRFVIDVAKSRLQAQAGLVGEIIERKQTEDELRRSDERFKIMFDYAPDSYVLTDQEGVLIDGNRASEKLLGFTKDDALGKNLLDLGVIPEDQIEKTMENLLKTIEGQSTGPDEVELISKDGEKVIIETRTFPVTIDGKDMVLATGRDITKQKQVENAKNNLLSNISHELRTPLTSIEGYTKFMLSGKLGEVPEKHKKCLDVIDEESGRLKILIDNFLDLMTIDAEGLRMKLRQIAVPDVIESLVSTLNLELEMKGISFSTDIGPDTGFIWGDENRLHQLFSNLLSNAIKFTPQGGSIEVRSREEDSSIIIEVEDTGVGISAKELPYVFSRFYQVDGSPSRKYGGVGLGLAICNEIVEAHGGHMEVESEPGKGSIFRVELPKYTEVLHGEEEDSGG